MAVLKNNEQDFKDDFVDEHINPRDFLGDREIFEKELAEKGMDSSSYVFEDALHLAVITRFYTGADIDEILDNVTSDVEKLSKKELRDLPQAERAARYMHLSKEAAKEFEERVEDIEDEFQVKFLGGYYPLRESKSFSTEKITRTRHVVVPYVATGLEEDEKQQARQVYNKIKEQNPITKEEENSYKNINSEINKFKEGHKEDIIEIFGSEDKYKKFVEERYEAFDKKIKELETLVKWQGEKADIYCEGIIPDIAIYTGMNKEQIIQRAKENRDLWVGRWAVLIDGYNDESRQLASKCGDLYKGAVLGLSKEGIEALKAEAALFNYEKTQDLCSAFRDAFSEVLEQENKSKMERSGLGQKGQTIEKDAPESDFTDFPQASEEKIQKVEDKSVSFWEWFLNFKQWFSHCFFVVKLILKFGKNVKMFIFCYKNLKIAYKFICF